MRAARFGYNLILLRHIYMKFANCLFIAAITFTSSMLEAQSVAVADLQQDMDNLSREVGRLRLEVEQLRRENSELLKRLQGLQGSSVDSESVRAQISGVRNAVNSQNEALKREIIASVKKDMEAMVEQTNAAIANIVRAVEARPQADLPTTFSEDYPKTGIPYVVKSGDTLGKLARQYNSRVKWIQDANKIADPSRGLHVGDKIFIPQQ